MSTTQCAYTRGSPEQNLTPWDLSPSSQTSTCRGVAKETVRSPSLYWELPRPAWWPTDSLSNCMQASIAYFCRPLVAKQTPRSVASACWRLIRLLEYLDEAVSYLLQSSRLLIAIRKLASAAKVTEQQGKNWLKKQAIWQIYLPARRHIPRPKFDVAVPNEVHKVDLLFLPHDRVRRKTFRYALTVVDVARRYKEAEPLTSKTAAEVADGLARIYKRSSLRWPKLLQVDPGLEFMGSDSQLLA